MYGTAGIKFSAALRPGRRGFKGITSAIIVCCPLLLRPGRKMSLIFLFYMYPYRLKFKMFKSKYGQGALK